MGPEVDPVGDAIVRVEGIVKTFGGITLALEFGMSYCLL